MPFNGTTPHEQTTTYQLEAWLKASHRQPSNPHQQLTVQGTNHPQTISAFNITTKMSMQYQLSIKIQTSNDTTEENKLRTHTHTQELWSQIALATAWKQSLPRDMTHPVETGNNWVRIGGNKERVNSKRALCNTEQRHATASSTTAFSTSVTFPLRGTINNTRSSLYVKTNTIRNHQQSQQDHQLWLTWGIMSLQQEQEQWQYTFTTVFEVTTCANKKKSSHRSN